MPETADAPPARESLLRQRPYTLWLTGLSGAGKTTIVRRLERVLAERGYLCAVLDGDALRGTLNRDLGFSAADRTENIRRAAEVAALFNAAGLIVAAAFISPYALDRDHAARVIGYDRFAEIFIDAPLAVCADRDPKGHYRRARAGELRNFTGIDAPYEAPLHPAVHLRTAELDVDRCVAALVQHLADRGALQGGLHGHVSQITSRR